MNEMDDSMNPIGAVTPVTDPVIQEVRRHKQAIAEEFGFDVVALGRSFQVRQAGDSRFATDQSEQGASDDHTAKK